MDNDALRLLAVIEAAGRDGVGLKTAGESLGWAQRGRLTRARDTLRQAGLITVLPGGRGRLVRITGVPLPDESTLDVATERGIYARLHTPLVRILMKGAVADAADDVPERNVAIAQTADLGGADSGGRHSRPDLTGVVRRPLGGFDALEVHGFEVKPYWAPGRLGVYEAVAQRALGLCTHAWVVWYLPDEGVHLSKAQRAIVAEASKTLKHVARETSELGLGLIVVRSLTSQGVRMLHWPTRSGADPCRLDAFLRQAAPQLLTQIGVEPRTVTA